MKCKDKCKKCGSTSFIEIIEKGMKQEIHYEDGYILKEITTYEKDSGKMTCEKCNQVYDEYDL